MANEDRVDLEIIPFVKDSEAKSLAKSFAQDLNRAIVPEVQKALALAGKSGTWSNAIGHQIGKGLANAKSFAVGAGKVAAGGLKGAAGGGLGGGVQGALMASGNPYAMAAGAGIGAVSNFIDQIKELVEVANPEVVEMFNAALRDIKGVIGQSLTPIIQALIPLIRMWGDFIASIIPSASQVNGIMQSLQPLFDDFRAELADLAPIIKMVVDWTIKLAAVIVQFTVYLLHLYNTIMKMLRQQTIEALGLPQAPGGAGSGRFSGSSVGAAARQASFTGIEQLGKDLQLAAFSKGLDPSVRTANAAEQINQKLGPWRQAPPPPDPGFAGAN